MDTDNGPGTSDQRDNPLSNPSMNVGPVPSNPAGTKRKAEEADSDPVIMTDADISCVGISDMCAPEVTEVRALHDNCEFHDETSGELLNPELVAQGCREELKRFEI